MISGKETKKKKHYQDIRLDLPPHHHRHLKPYYNGTPIELTLSTTKKLKNMKVLILILMEHLETYPL